MNDIHEQAALYVVDALTPEESQEFEVHLATCVACQEDVAAMHSVTAHLIRPEDPPPSLRASVLARIAETAQEPVVAPEPRPSPRMEPSRATDNVIPLQPRRPSRLPYLVAAASVLLALGFGGWALQSRQDANQASDRQAQIVRILGAPDVRTFNHPVENGGDATVVLSKTLDRALFVANGLPSLPENKVYELWTISGTPVPAGTFTSTDAAAVFLPDAALTADAVALTVEPEGGSDQPTTTPILALPLA